MGYDKGPKGPNYELRAYHRAKAVGVWADTSEWFAVARQLEAPPRGKKWDKLRRRHYRAWLRSTLRDDAACLRQAWRARHVRTADGPEPRREGST